MSDGDADELDMVRVTSRHQAGGAGSVAAVARGGELLVRHYRRIQIGGDQRPRLRGRAQGAGARIASIAFDAAMRPISTAIGGALGGLTSAFAGGAATKMYARGGVVGGPTLFPMARGIGLAGEAGPEAILPLARGADGRLGVASGGATPTVVHVT